MARADLLKALFRGYKSGDESAFLEAATSIIDEERMKHHVVVANDLHRILKGGSGDLSLMPRGAFEHLPKDNDRGMPLVETRRPRRYLEDIILSRYQLDIIESVINEIEHRDILSANGLSPSNKILFCGPPGCGKTVTAEAIANRLGLPLLYVRFDSVVSSLLGETASNLRKVFDYASKGSWVLLFDEFDTVGRSRDDPTEHGELKRVVNAFLQMLDSFDGRSLIIAATNFEQSLDIAMWRRFDEIVRFVNPNKEQIVALIDRRLRNKEANPNLWDSVADNLLGMSYAEVERVCVDVMKRVALKGRRTIRDGDILWAVNKQERRKQLMIDSESDGHPSIDKV